MLSVIVLILASGSSAWAALTCASSPGLPNVGPAIQDCINQPSFYSCENATSIGNSCCSPTPGGLVLQAQFWSTYGVQKFPKESWTIHGLWPDNCDSSYESYCDLSRQYDPVPDTAPLPDGTHVPAYKGPGVDTFIKAFKRGALLDYMNDYWINQLASNEAFWAHEFSKHATCTSTFDVACYGKDYQKHQEVVDFYETVVRVFQQFPTYKFLETVGIVPSNTTSYTLNQLQTAIRQQVGATPYLGCTNNGTVLSEVWYFTHVYGTEQLGHYKPVESTTKSTCSGTGPVWYYKRSTNSEHEVRN